MSAIEDIKAQYYRSKGTDERPSKFAMRLDEEQTHLAADNVVILEPDKFQHYLSEVCKSGMFTVEAIAQWTEKPPPQQTY